METSTPWRADRHDPRERYLVRPYERERSARSSSAFVIFERPRMFRSRASSYNWSLVGPRGLRRWLRIPPRLPEEMSSRESRDASRASPCRARSLFTVRAAISSARSSEAPRSRADSLMCSYWRARFVPFFTPRGGISQPPFLSEGVLRRRSTRDGRAQTLGFGAWRAWNGRFARKGVPMYIGAGTVVALILIVLLIMLLT
jgi:hypothetical protein